ncbi:2TM domain-containing protein [Polaribacter sargassicola]|uniref:2TM domain-containing protein n=1 Tax=Polaribacter sargassicola TaxID=2836891 RepID=UPI001F3BB73E|nr:2TM domain-containing protein [Polaribacter sp. DS7-9]
MNKITQDKMESNYTQEQKLLIIKKRVKKIKGFYSHLTVYCIIIPTLIFINLKFDPGFHWFWFSLCGWGIGLFFHWFSVFGMSLIGLGENWEEKKIKEFMNEK